MFLSSYCLVPVGTLFQINQLEKDKDVVAQAEAITSLEGQPQLSFSVVNAFSNFLGDPKVCLVSSHSEVQVIFFFVMPLTFLVHVCSML